MNWSVPYQLETPGPFWTRQTVNIDLRRQALCSMAENQRNCPDAQSKGLNERQNVLSLIETMKLHTFPDISAFIRYRGWLLLLNYGRFVTEG